MRAARFHRFGGPELLRIDEIPSPELRPGHVRVQVRAAAMNHLDLWIRRGLPIDTTMPHIGGSDIAGLVMESAPDAEDWVPGTPVVINPILFCGRCEFCLQGEESLCRDFRILGEHTDGGFADEVVVPAYTLHQLPEDFPFELAAALPVSYQTAWRALIHRAELRPGEDVLVLGASGGTGMAAVQVARLTGARVFAVTSGEEEARRLRELGAHRVYDRSRVDFSREVWRDTDKRGVDLVVESVGEKVWHSCIRALRPGGRLVTFGATTGAQGVTDLRLLFWRQLRLIGSTMASRSEFREMLAVALRGELTPVIDRTYPLTEIRAAHERLEGGEQFGKIVILP